MHASNLVKQEFLAKWISGLKKCDSPAKSMMSVIERKKKIKLSADIAIAAVRRGATCWSRAIIAQASSRNTAHKLLARRILSKARSRPRILTRSRIEMNLSKCSVKRRKERLKSLVPGGDLMDDNCLIRETLDYIVYLRAQVEVMRTVAADSAAGRVAGNIASNDHRTNVANK